MTPHDNKATGLVVQPRCSAWPPSRWRCSLTKVAAATLAKPIVIALLLISGWMPKAAVASEIDIASFQMLETHCIHCHGLASDDPAGDVSLASFDSRASVLSNRPIWKRVLEVVEGHEMPPAEDDSLDEKDRQTLVTWIKGVLAEPELGGRTRAGKPTLRRLTRLEYSNSVRDLLGLETDVFMFSERLPFNKSYFNPASGSLPSSFAVSTREYGSKYPVFLPAAGLPADSRADHGFSNRGDVQDFSAVQLEQYVELAEMIAFHPDLLSLAERMQEMFPHSQFRVPVPSAPPQVRQQAILNVTSNLGANNNVARTATGSAWSIEEFRQRVAKAYSEDRGGVYSVIGNENTTTTTTTAGKGGVLQLAFGENAAHVFGINPSEDLWNVVFATAKASSGNAILTNRVKDRKQFFLGFQKSGDSSWQGIVELGIVVISREGQSGKVRLSVEYDDDTSESIDVELKAGAGADNTFVSFAAPKQRIIRKLSVDGSEFSGPYVLLDDLAFVSQTNGANRSQLVGIEQPQVSGNELPGSEVVAASIRQAIKIDRSLATRSPREQLAHFMRRAFRRNVVSEEVDLYLGLYEAETRNGSSDEVAMRRAIQGVLASPSFLYLMISGAERLSEKGAEIEREDTGPKPSLNTDRTLPLTDHELASRLSYFLWSSMPDDELLALADAGKLSEPSILEQQVRRMLRDSRIRELSENFYVEWMRLRELWSVQPDRRAFSPYYAGPSGKNTLADDMFIEALLLFEKILIEDRSILELIHSDYTFVNADLARLYGIDEDVQGWQQVLLNDAKRGGVMTTAAMLTLTSYPHRTSSIRRGNWFLETILNRPPPAPKVAVAEIDDQQNVDHLTLREKVELHRADAACAVCHDRIDPPGFVLENYDAIGRWREQDGDEAIDPSGSLPWLGSFADVSEFKRLLLEDRVRFTRGFIEHLLSYSLSRKLEYFDVAQVDKIVSAAQGDSDSLSRIIVEIVQSDSFQNVDIEQE